MNKLFEKLVAMGVTDSDEAAMIIQHYLTTGVLTRNIK